jgi:hypothetical protein
MYVGAWTVLNDGTNPDRIALAAHAMRELMEKGQRELAVSVKPAALGSGQTGVAFERLDRLCRRARQESEPYRSRSGPIDEIVARVLEAAEELVAVHNQERPGRVAQREDLIRRLDPLGAALPAEMVADWMERWDNWDRLFQLTSHHQIAPTAEELASAMDEFTAFLLERLEPVPSRAREEIEQLIREAEDR